MPTTTPFLKFEDDFHRFSQTVDESMVKLTPVAAQTVVGLATRAFCESYFEFCYDQFRAIRGLRPALVRRKDIVKMTSGEQINDRFRLLVRRNLFSAKDSNRLNAISRECGFKPSRKIAGLTPSLLDWADVSEFLFDLAVTIARETGTAGKRGLDSKKKEEAKIIAALDRLLTARFDQLA